MGVTLNKNGKPRKIGSGKTKGAGCFAKIKWKHLKEFISEEEEILVGRVWLRSVGALNQKRGTKKKLLPNQSKILKPPPKKQSPKDYKPHSPVQKQTIPLPPSENNDGDDYEPPPLFASMGEIKRY